MIKKIAVTFVVLMFMALLLTPAKAARAFETSSPTNTEAGAIMPFSLKLPLPTADGCQPLLYKSTGENPAYAMDQTRRSEGESGAVSVVVGLRFALGSEPKRRTSRNAPPAETMAFGAWTVRDDGVGNSQALALSEYRRCRAQLQDQR
ncbi:hypothetical protein [Micavibrio aeruginosavorus]|uniref:hypothetical protein n=1 Tax=Micavibrio aeruginosavorus TaxID=349221 RepID=UPI003F4A96C0